MKKTLIFVTCIMLTTSLAFASTPETISKSYFDLLKGQQWDKISELYDPTALRDFKNMMSFMTELPDEAATQVLSQFFGAGTTKESLKTMSDVKFFSSFLKGVMAQVAQVGQLDFKKVEILGSVPEGTGLSHVVTRTTIEMGEIRLESMEIISFKKTNAGWKILLQGKIKGMAQQIKKALSQKR